MNRGHPILFDSTAAKSAKECVEEITTGTVKKRDIVYRALKPGELDTIQAGQGILRPAGGRTTATQHVMGVTHERDAWISTTRSPETANFFATHGYTKPPNPIVAIDLSKVKSFVLDVSNKELAEQVLKHPRAVGFASEHQEVLIHGNVNPEAIVGIVEDK